jgi:NAD(P)H-dependent FMN reductase
MTQVVAITGSYRHDGVIDSAVAAVLAGARRQGAETATIRLMDRHIEFCTNCRACTQAPGVRRGLCVQHDDLEEILARLDAADAIVLGAPVNFYNVSGVFRRFMERLLGAAHWPWGARFGPVVRDQALARKAVLVSSAAMPGFLLPLATGAPRALKVTARILGARPVGRLWIGLAAIDARQPLSARILARAEALGRKLG